LAGTAQRFDDRVIVVNFDDGAVVEQPEQTHVIDPCKGPLSITAEQIERPPAESRRSFSPSAVEEAGGVTNEAPPTLRWHVTRWVVQIKTRKPFSPRARHPAIVFNDSGPFFLGVSPSIDGAGCKQR
jgi:hypothetical protein